MDTERESLVLLAPFAGWCTSLDDLPDPVFAGRMLGDGVAIDPLEPVLHAPCDGEVIALPASRHAITLRAANGAEVLLHVGIDTVALHGQGFEACVSVGDRVRAGAPLLRFDLDAVAQRAPSLLTPILVLSAGYAVSQLAVGTSLRTGDPLLRMTATGSIAGTSRNDTRGGIGAGATSADTEPSVVQQEAIVRLEHGLHARPAARIVDAARAAAGAAPTRIFNGREADARSVTALMTLGVRHGDRLIIQARGADAGVIATRIAAVLAGEGEAAARKAGDAAVPRARASQGSNIVRTALPSSADAAVDARGRHHRCRRKPRHRSRYRLPSAHGYVRGARARRGGCA